MDIEGYMTDMDGVGYAENPYSAYYTATWEKTTPSEVVIASKENGSVTYFRLPAELFKVVASRLPETANEAVARKKLEEVPF